MLTDTILNLQLTTYTSDITTIANPNNTLTVKAYGLGFSDLINTANNMTSDDWVRFSLPAAGTITFDITAPLLGTIVGINNLTIKANNSFTQFVSVLDLILQGSNIAVKLSSGDSAGAVMTGIKSSITVLTQNDYAILKAILQEAGASAVIQASVSSVFFWTKFVVLAANAGDVILAVQSLATTKLVETFTIIPSASVSGTVTLNGVGLAGVTISWSVTNGSGGGGGSIITDSNGNYLLSIQNGYTYTITPSMSGYTFTPSSRTGTVNGADVTGQDFVGTGTDTTPPTVFSTNPADTATNVAVNTTITATFSEAMDSSTINTSTFTLSGGVTGTVTYSGTTATFTPSSNLAYNTTYTATVTTGVRDTSGNAMASNYTWSFTTGGSTFVDDGGPFWSPDGTKIAFVSNRDGNNEIYIMNADGTNQTRLTYNNADDIQPSWSPDGTKIAFRTYRDGNSELYVMNADGTNPFNLTNNLDNYDGEPQWSPDGSKIVFSSWRSGAADIWVMNSDGTNPVQLTNGLWASNPAWSPDGTRIAFSYQGNISVMNADGTNRTTILSVGCCISPYVGSWSPDGTKIAIYSDRFDGNFEIYTINSDGTNRVRLTNNSASDSNPSWSLSAAKIAFTSNRDGNYEIYTMNPDGTNQTRLTNN